MNNPVALAQLLQHPVGGLEGSSETLPPLRWGLDPCGYTDPEGIMVDEGALRNLACWAGLGSITVQPYREEGAAYTIPRPRMNGFAGVEANSDGSLAVVARTEVAATTEAVQTNRIEADQNIPIEFRWGHGTVAPDRGRIARRISADKKRGFSEAEAWSRQYNRSLKLGLLALGVKSLLVQPFTERSNALRTVTALAAAGLTGLFFGPKAAIVAYEGINLAYTASAKRALRDTPGGEDLAYKKTAFAGGLALDRFAVFAYKLWKDRLIYPAAVSHSEAPQRGLVAQHASV